MYIGGHVSQIAFVVGKPFVVQLLTDVIRVWHVALNDLKKDMTTREGFYCFPMTAGWCPMLDALSIYSVLLYFLGYGRPIVTTERAYERCDNRYCSSKMEDCFRFTGQECCVCPPAYFGGGSEGCWSVCKLCACTMTNNTSMRYKGIFFSYSSTTSLASLLPRGQPTSRSRRKRQRAHNCLRFHRHRSE